MEAILTLDPYYSLNEVHNIAHRVENKLKKSSSCIQDVVHIDPCDDNNKVW